MKSREREKEISPKLEIIKELEKLQKSDPKEEIDRLKSIPRVAKSLKICKLPTEKHQIAFGRSIELREKLKDTHYIINHGQNLELMVLNMVTRKLKQEFESRYHEAFEPLRHDVALRDIQENTHTVNYYKNRLREWNVTDHDFRNELLCGDCVLESTEEFESALDFFAGGKNVALKKNEKWIDTLFQPIIQYYFPDKDVQDQLFLDLSDLLKRFPEGKDKYSTQGGNLYSICVPKERFDESCYFSKASGRPREDAETLKEKIDEMQSGEYKPKVEFKQDSRGVWGSYGNTQSPQIRILTHKIRPEDGFHVVLNSTLTSEEFKNIEEEVSCCIQAALISYRLKKPTKNTKFF